ncbi:hypothetical protein IV203_008027 [Nitzschia inconspicua]|uniref:Uncharacterized protein n=1 Tax=Nitzschia inconspicua TaxID=303405 RepID=A0A9K3KXR0_9STRA|nr:hypothetical protein IV203_008027 [Nitzschia inconspicua]
MGKSHPSRTADTRTRLLNSLGLFQPEIQRRIYHKQQPMFFSGDSAPTSSDNSLVCASSLPATATAQQPTRHTRRWSSDMPSVSALRNPVVFETQLKDHEAIAHKKSFKNNTPHHRKSSSLVRFNTVVSCVQIPSRSQYSKRIKKTLWRDREELSEMVERNTEEFRAENYDWTNVVLDDDMYLDADNGELVHPCHVSSSTEDFTPMNDSDSTDEEGDGRLRQGNADVEGDYNDDEDDYLFVPLGQKGKSTWEVLKASP